MPKGLLEFKVCFSRLLCQRIYDEVKIEEHIEVNEIAKNDTILIDVVGLTNVPSFRKNGKFLAVLNNESNPAKF